MIIGISILALVFTVAIIACGLAIAYLRRKVEILEERINDLDHISHTLDENICDCQNDNKNIKRHIERNINEIDKLKSFLVI